MDNIGLGSRHHNLKAVLDDPKKNIRKLADFIAVGITDNREMASDMKQLVLDMQHVSYQTRCHDSCIDDHEIDLRELMGMADCIKEYLHKLIQMNQCIHCQDSPGDEA